MVYEMKITISTVDSNTLKHGNVLNNLPALIVYVVTSGLTKHTKKKLSTNIPNNQASF
jgi:hypothetical protein